MTLARGLTPLVLLLPAAFGCRHGEVATHNLDVVMSSEDRLRYVGDLQGPIEYFLRGFVDPSALEEGSWLAGDDDEPIKDPTDVAVENLLDLADTTDGPRRWREAEEVRHFARYAAECPAGLGRERALLELGAHGRRLGLSEPHRAPASPANAAELRVRLEGLVDGARSLLAQGRKAPQTAVADFVAACEVLGAAEVDLAGGRRVLRAVSPFFRQASLSGEAEAALVSLSERVQRQVVGEALARGLRDELPYVRAAALRANTAVFGDSFLVEAALVLAVRPTQPLLPHGHGAAFTRFGLVPEPADVAEARVAVCQMLAERGLPAPVAGTDAAALTVRYGLFATLVQLASRYELFPSRARVHAMLALEEVTGARVASLREEDWDRWWKVVGPELEAACRTAEAERGTATPDPDAPLKNDPGAGRSPGP